MFYFTFLFYYFFSARISPNVIQYLQYIKLEIYNEDAQNCTW